jgi:hypothetical protein
MPSRRHQLVETLGRVFRLRVLALAASSLGILAPNQGCVETQTPSPTAAPTFSPASGTAIPAGGLDVTITSSDAGAAIRYTSDGTTPTSSVGTVVSGPVHLAATTTLRAIAYADGMPASSVAEAAYALASTDDSSTTTTLDDGHKLYNVAADFIAYAEQADSADAAGRQTQWEQLLEAKYPDFFNQIVYGNLTGQERTDLKAQIIDQFWNETVPALDALKQVSATAVQKVVAGRPAFKAIFPDFDPQADYYLTVSFDFVGKASEVAGKKAELLALNRFDPNDPELDITIAHEHFHLHHFATFSPSGGLYRGVWSEGMAVYASTLVHPGYRLLQYLSFSGPTIDQMHDLFGDLVDDILTNIDSSDQTIKRAYLGTEPNSTWIPPGSGYYIGFYLVQALVEGQGNAMADMTRWDATPTVHKALVDTLPTLSAP